MARTGERETMAPIRRSAPAALSQAASTTEAARNGDIQSAASRVKAALSKACSGRPTARTRNSRPSASQTRSILRSTPRAPCIAMARSLICFNPPIKPAGTGTAG